jgi:hypothetical protein
MTELEASTPGPRLRRSSQTTVKVTIWLLGQIDKQLLQCLDCRLFLGAAIPVFNLPGVMGFAQ